MDDARLRTWLDAMQEGGELMGRLRGCLERTYPGVAREGSQHDEDAIVAELLAGKTGTYVDVGAGPPVDCSNTWKYYQQGWRGLLIEPLYWYWPSLLHQRPGDMLYDSAVRDYDGYADLRVHGMLSSVLSTWHIGENCKIIVPCERMDTVLSRFPDVRDNCRLCSIDVEGVEGEVLAGIDWNTFRPDVFVIEYRTYHPDGPGEDMSSQWEHYLTEQGYRLASRNDLNAIYHLSPEHE